MNRAATTALIAVACLAVPAAASASVATTTSVNRHTDRAALNAYATYLQSLEAGKASAVAAEQLFASNTTATCYKALAPLATSQSVPAGTSAALTSIGDEIGADAGLEFLTSAATPMSQLASTLAGLHWGSYGPALTVKRFLAANQELTALAPSNLCKDANWVFTQAQEDAPEVTVPAATTTFLETYTTDSNNANQRLAAFVKLLDSYATSSDTPVATKIDLLAAKVNALSSAAITAGTNSLFRSLGIPVAAAAASFPAPKY